MAHNEVLEPADIAGGYILACQAVSLAPEVSITYRRSASLLPSLPFPSRSFCRPFSPYMSAAFAEDPAFAESSGNHGCPDAP
jgi:hypothetical protein